METTVKPEKKKKGFLAAIWESMTKTGGCCGGGGDCCGAPQQATSAKDKPGQETGGAASPRG